MHNALTAAGLTTATQSELVTNDTSAYQTIYGTDINLDQDSPDGQMMMIRIQAVLDLLDFVRQVYNSFDPDQAIGVTLDQRVAINGIQRQAGTFTTTNITVITSQALNLYGLDQTTNEIFTVADNAGNQWQLLTTTNISGAGSYALAFQAADPGATLTVPNTITVPVTIVLGVTSINNPTTYTTLGINEETDAALKIRRQKSVSLASQGYLAGLLAALENISGVSSAFVYENDTGATNGDGVPGHSIWVIVSGSAAASDIAQAIYTKRNGGAGMYGQNSYSLTQADGSSFMVYWDTVIPQNLFMKFSITSLNGINPPNIAAIRSGLVTAFVPAVNQQVNINDLATLVQQIDPNALVTNAGFSLSASGSFTATLSPSAKNNQFVVQSTDIIILPMILSPVSFSITHGLTQQLTALGGFGMYTYALSVNASGGSVNSSGLYTAGTTGGVTDTVLVTDAQGNTATSVVTVV